MRGRKPDPPQVHKLRGTFREERHGETLELPTCTPEPPAELDDVGLEEWHRVVAELEAIGTVHKLDRALLALHCMLWSDLIAARKSIAEFGHVVKGVSGAAMQNPSFGIAKASATLLTRVDAELGLSPTSRTRLRIKEPFGSKLDKPTGKNRFFVPGGVTQRNRQA